MSTKYLVLYDTCQRKDLRNRQRLGIDWVPVLSRVVQPIDLNIRKLDIKIDNKFQAMHCRIDQISSYVGTCRVCAHERNRSNDLFDLWASFFEGSGRWEKWIIQPLIISACLKSKKTPKSFPGKVASSAKITAKCFKFCTFSRYTVHITVLSHPGGHWSVKNHVIVDYCDSNSHISLSSHYGYGMVFFRFKSTGKGAVILKD